jgi:hypothetical protein
LFIVSQFRRIINEKSMLEERVRLLDDEVDSLIDELWRKERHGAETTLPCHRGRERLLRGNRAAEGDNRTQGETRSQQLRTVLRGHVAVIDSLRTSVANLENAVKVKNRLVEQLSAAEYELEELRQEVASQRAVEAVLRASNSELQHALDCARENGSYGELLLTTFDSNGERGNGKLPLESAGGTVLGECKEEEVTNTEIPIPEEPQLKDRGEQVEELSVCEPLQPSVERKDDRRHGGLVAEVEGQICSVEDAQDLVSDLTVQALPYDRLASHERAVKATIVEEVVFQHRPKLPHAKDDPNDGVSGHLREDDEKEEQHMETRPRERTETHGVPDVAADSSYQQLTADREQAVHEELITTRQNEVECGYDEIERVKSKTTSRETDSFRKLIARADSLEQENTRLTREIERLVVILELEKLKKFPSLIDGVDSDSQTATTTAADEFVAHVSQSMSVAGRIIPEDGQSSAYDRLQLASDAAMQPQGVALRDRCQRRATNRSKPSWENAPTTNFDAMQMSIALKRQANSPTMGSERTAMKPCFLLVGITGWRPPISAPKHGKECLIVCTCRRRRSSVRRAFSPRYADDWTRISSLSHSYSDLVRQMRVENSKLERFIGLLCDHVNRRPVAEETLSANRNAQRDVVIVGHVDIR